MNNPTKGLTMKQRGNGGGHRLLDGERFTVSIGSDYICDGGHRRPKVRIIDRKLDSNGKMRGKRGHRSVTIPLPHVRFRRCYRLRHVGGMQVFRAYQRVMRAICVAPRKTAV